MWALEDYPDLFGDLSTHRIIRRMLRCWKAYLRNFVPFVNIQIRQPQVYHQCTSIKYFSLDSVEYCIFWKHKHFGCFKKCIIIIPFTALNSLVSKLDKRRRKQDKGGRFSAKQREKGQLSKLPVPLDAPGWIYQAEPQPLGSAPTTVGWLPV